ncbi:hypothetical protein FB45DRAFT_1040949 [Roridomyces roridus]|uniref:Uncharacterized protein n=1 Tax=Roridomyces roridus TaxID=1738132 RepID=A0AAD7F7A0_9AGAR|nr:hypothetical protein FB45DRAFT_1040949 [Roridomyces roridus]
MAKNPTHKAIKFSSLERDYGAHFFRDALSRYLVQLSNPDMSSRQIERKAITLEVPFNTVPTFQRIKFSTPDPYAKDEPQSQDSRAIRYCYRITQVRVVFTLPERLAATILPPNIRPPTHLAHVEWFSAFKSQPERHRLMYKVTRVIKNGDHWASIIPVNNIRRSVHLL